MPLTSQEIIEIYGRLRGSTVWSALVQTALRLPHKVAVVDGENRYTYAQVVERASRLASGLYGAGLKKGDVAAVYMKNSIELVTVFYALQKLGVIIAWINPNYRETESRFIIGNSNARAVFIFPEWLGYDYTAAVAKMAPELPDLSLIVAAGVEMDTKAGGIRLAGLGTLTRGGESDADHEPVGPDDLSMLLFTSGTTGKPKGATIRQYQVVLGGWSYALGVDATEEDSFIGFLPMAHSYGCGALLVQPFILGATLVAMDRFTPAGAFAVIEKERCTIQLGSPAHYLMELRDDSRKSRDLKSLRAGLIAGQIAPEGLIRRVEEEMGIYIASFLGSSEVGPGLSIILPYGSSMELRERSIGYPLEGTEIRVVDPATGEERAPGEPGELLLKGWHVMAGYWKNPEETANQLKNGWLHTGDLAARDPDGSVRILGRIKEWINRGGLKVIPSELEGLLVKMPGVEEAFVVGTQNPILGESICACVKLAPGAEVSLKGVRSFLERKVAPHKLPDELFKVEEFPKMPGGIKVNKFGAGGLAELAGSSKTKETLR